MILADISIQLLLENGTLVIEPFDVTRLQPSSYDLTLGNEFWHKGKLITAPRFLLFPQMFVLGTTRERFEIPAHLVAQIHNKSTLRRQGLTVCCDAGYVDPGFRGQLTMEIGNHGHEPFDLREGMRIGQITFIRMDRPAVMPYGHKDLGSHYQYQIGVTPAKFDR